MSGYRVNNTSYFIERSKLVHGDRYDYTKSIYTRSTNKIEIVCKKHGSFWQKASHHMNGIGCPICGGRSPYTTESYICKAKEVHGDKYNYSLVVYSRHKDKIQIICPVHGVFNQIAGDHLQGKGCSRCARNVRLTTEEFILRAKQVHGDKYTYSNTVYISGHNKVTITCPKHGDFTIDPQHFLKGIGCSSCKNSLGSNSVRAWLDNHNISYKAEYKTKECKDKKELPFDFAISDENGKLLGLVEYDGQQHFEPCSLFGKGQGFMITVLHDAIKNQFCEDNNIPLLRIPYWDKDKIPEKLETFLKEIQA